MRTLSIDIETRARASLPKAGVYRYSEDADFQILLFAYATDNNPVQVVDLANGETIPSEIISALSDPSVVKWAHNATFERVCLSRFLQFEGKLSTGCFLDPAQWRCTMIHAAYLGLPLSLADVGNILGLEKQKDSAGRKLISRFCVPDKNGMFIEPGCDPVGWSQFKAYNLRDVETEKAIFERLSKHPMPGSEWENYALDQRINDTGIRLDLALVSNAVKCDQAHHQQTLAKAQELTGLDNPNSPAQLKEWLATNGCALETLTKAEVAAALDTANGKVEQVLRLRGELAKTSTRKYLAMLTVAGSDGRARGLIQFYGAGRTGRFAGRLVQVQNLPRNYLPDLAHARALVRAGQFDALELLYPSVPDTLSQLIRTAFIPSPGNKFIVADFSAIEARVIAWLAGEKWRLELFKGGGDIYCQSATQMFGVPVAKHGPNAELRQKGKISELACGYGGAAGALEAMGALRMGLKQDELQPLVDAWRASNPHIVTFWADLDRAAKQTIKTHTPTRVGRIGFQYKGGLLQILLPSGRCLSYVKPAIGTNRFGGESITYKGVDGASKKWGQLETYSGKLAENITQAVARDLLTHAMQTVTRAGHQIVMHVHDEIIIDTPPQTTVGEVCELMTQTPPWADGLPLDADGYACDFYMKD